MSLTLNNDPINLGDRLFHLTYGYGTVIEMNTDFFRLNFASGGSVTVYPSSLSGDKQLVYWYQPLFIQPKKGMQAKHQKALAITEKVLTMMAEES